MSLLRQTCTPRASVQVVGCYRSPHRRRYLIHNGGRGGFRRRRRFPRCSCRIRHWVFTPATSSSAGPAASTTEDTATDSPATRSRTPEQCVPIYLGLQDCSADAPGPSDTRLGFLYLSVSPPKGKPRAGLPEVVALGVQRYSGRLWPRPDHMRFVSQVRGCLPPRD